MKIELRKKLLNNDLVLTSHKGCFIYHKGNTDAHEDLKYKVFTWAKKQGYLVITEARFKDGKRADVVIADLGIVVEIETNQKPANVLKKKATYQYDWLDYVVVLDPAKVFNEKDLL